MCCSYFHGHPTPCIANQVVQEASQDSSELLWGKKQKQKEH